MLSRFTLFALAILTAVCLFSADVLLVREARSNREAASSQIATALATIFSEFIERRLDALEVHGMIARDEHGADPDAFRRDSERCYGRLSGIESVWLCGPSFNVLATWPEGNRNGTELPPEAPIGDLTTSASAGGPHLCIAVESATRASVYMATTVEGPQEKLHLVSRLRLRPALQQVTAAGLALRQSIQLEGPHGEVIVPAGQPFGSEVAQRAAVRVGNQVWWLRLSASKVAGGELILRRLALFGIGLIPALVFFTVFFIQTNHARELHAQGRKLAEQVEQREHVNERLARLNRELDEFTYVVSHDLKEPLRAVEGITRMFLEEHGGRLDAPGRELVESIRASGGRMRRLVDDLLRLSRVTRRRYPKETVKFTELIQETINAYKYAIEEKRAKVVVAENLPDVLCDRVRMMEVFGNLLSNALKFTDGRAPEIDIGFRPGAEVYTFWIRDNGIGVRPDDSKRIFEIFQRANPEAGDGSGVGLTICKRIVENHGGRIWVEPDPRAGACFFFTLPVHPDGGASAAPGEEETA